MYLYPELTVGQPRLEFGSDVNRVSGGEKTKKVKLELMKKKERKKLRKMKSDKFEMTAKAKALWEECRRYVRSQMLSQDIPAQ